MPLNSRSIWITFDTPQEIPLEFHKSEECPEGFAKVLEEANLEKLACTKYSVIAIRFDEVHINNKEVVVTNWNGERKFDLSDIARMRIS